MKYQCNECEHVFEGSSYSTQCPECGSENIIPFKSSGSGNWFEKIKVWLKENKLIAAAIILILALILIPRDEEEITTTNVVYSLHFEKNTNFCMVYLKDAGAQVAYSDAIYSFLNLTATITSEDGSVYTVPVETNKIEYCESGTLSISYNDKGVIKLESKYKGEFTINEIKPLLTSGNCIPQIIVTEVSYNSSTCKVDVKVVQCKRHAKISINGEHGDYKKSQSFDIDGITAANFDIWYYPEGPPSDLERFNNEKAQFNDPKQIAEVLSSIEDTSPGDKKSIDKKAKKLEEEFIKVVELLKLGDDESAVDIYEEISGMFPRKAVFSLSGNEFSLFSFVSEITVHLDHEKTLKPSRGNIGVTGSSSGCGKATYEFTISL